VDLRAGNPDFAKLAEAYGCAGVRVTRPEEVESAIQQALAVDDRPAVVDIIVSPEENVYPMIPAGTTINDMIVEGPA
jgi:acetolactate synthase I/II/III large subunit